MITVVASAIVQKDNAILFIRETKSIAKHKYGLPGGKLEAGETLEACAIREFKEETGLDIRTKDLVAVTHKPHTHEGNNVIRFIYTAESESEAMADHEMQAVWLTAAEIRDLSARGQIRGKDVASLTIQYLETGIKPIRKPTVFD